MASFEGTTIYCSPAKAMQVPTYPNLNKTVTISRSQASKIAEYYNNGEAGVAAGIAFLANILASPLGPFSVILGVVTGFAASVAAELWEDRDDYFYDLATNEDGQESWKMKIKYKYVRHGSNSGAWFMRDFEVIEA